MNAKEEVEFVVAPEVVKVNEIISVVVHTLKKEDEKGFSLDLAERPLQVTAIIQKTTDLIVGQYGGRLGKSHGKFESNVIDFPFQVLLKGCLEGGKDFFDTTVDMMGHLLERARRTTAKGGHVFFVNYNKKKGDDQLSYFMVAILHDELGAAITQGKDVVESKYLDIKGLKFAGLVDVNSWQAGNEGISASLKGRSRIESPSFLSFSLVVIMLLKRETKVKRLKVW